MQRRAIAAGYLSLGHALDKRECASQGADFGHEVRGPRELVRIGRPTEPCDSASAIRATASSEQFSFAQKSDLVLDVFRGETRLDPLNLMA